MGKPIVVVSAVNLTEGGPLTVLRDCITAFSEVKEKRVVFIVADKTVHDGLFTGDIEFYYFPKVKSSWLKRLWFEYFFLKKFSINLGTVDVWLSLHDMSPRVTSGKQYVYCHNPSPFVDITFKDFLLDPKQYLFSKFYGFLYRINIKANSGIIVQQHWFGEYFKRIAPDVSIFVANPDVSSIPDYYLQLVSASTKKYYDKIEKKKDFFLFYPAYPRYFKNHFLLVSALSGIKNVKLKITLSGDENRLAKSVMESVKSRRQENIIFSGLLPRDKVLLELSRSDALIFPSLIETWGLPISEAIRLNKVILVADLPYAHETVGNYEKVYWFDPKNIISIRSAVYKFIENAPFDGPKVFKKEFREIKGWSGLCELICCE